MEGAEARRPLRLLRLNGICETSVVSSREAPAASTQQKGAHGVGAGAVLAVLIAYEGERSGKKRTRRESGKRGASFSAERFLQAAICRSST
jgi:hypothetical protein